MAVDPMAALLAKVQHAAATRAASAAPIDDIAPGSLSSRGSRAGSAAPSSGVPDDEFGGSLDLGASSSTPESSVLGVRRQRIPDMEEIGRAVKKVKELSAESQAELDAFCTVRN
jgi:hypothetical protein